MAEKIMIGIPHHTGMHAKFHLSLTNLAYTLNMKGYEVDLHYAEGTVLSTTRNQLCSAALDGGFDLLMIDSDMTFNVSDGFQILHTPGEVVGGLCFMRRFPYKPVVFQEDLVETEGVFRNFLITEIPNEPFECKGAGAAFLLIRQSALKKLTDAQPIWGSPFNFYSTIKNQQLGEDLSFCHRCNQLGIKMICVPTVDIGHMAEVEIRRSNHLMAVQRDHHYCNDIPGKLTLGEQNWLYSKAKEHYRILQPFEDAKADKTIKDARLAADPDNPFAGLHYDLQPIRPTTHLQMVFITAHDEIREALTRYRGHCDLVCGTGYLHNPKVHAVVNELIGIENLKTYEGIWYYEDK